MASAFNPFDAEVQRLIEETTPGAGGAPPPLPGFTAAPQTLQIGNELVPVNDPKALSDAITRREAAFREELAQFQRMQQTTPTVQQQPQTVVVQQPPPGRPARLDAKTYAEIFEAEGPEAATARAFAQHLGLPEGTSPAQVILGLGNALLTQGKTLEEVQTVLKSVQTDIAKGSITSEVGEFQRQHPEYIADPANFALLNQVREQYQLPATAVGLDGALRLAQSMGAPLKLRQAQTDPQWQPGPGNTGYNPYPTQWGPPPTPQQSGFPRMQGGGSTGAAPSQAEEAMFNHLERLRAAGDEAGWQRAIDQFKTVYDPNRGQR